MKAVPKLHVERNVCLSRLSAFLLHPYAPAPRGFRVVGKGSLRTLAVETPDQVALLP